MDTTDYYKTLNVDKDATSKQIKTAYKKMALKYHPDKIQNSTEQQKKVAEEKFKNISQAYSVLSDPEKRKIYDQFGIKGLSDNGNGGGFPPFNFFDINNLFSQQSQRRPQIKVYRLEVDLDAFYFGSEIRINIKCKIKCEECNGTGASSHDLIQSCEECDGKGIKMKQTASPFGMCISQQQCTKCNGTAQFIPISAQCQVCKSSKTIDKNIEFKTRIPKGGNYSETIIPKKGDYDPQTGERGNLLLQLVSPSPQQRKYTKYTRNGNDLMLELDITLKQSLIGFNIDIPHFGKIVRIASDKVISPGFIRCIKEKGMPIVNSTNNYGDLNIKFNVIFPDSITNENKKLLENIL